MRKVRFDPFCVFVADSGRTDSEIDMAFLKLGTGLKGLIEINQFELLQSADTVNVCVAGTVYVTGV